jgi:PRTRC genetic system protein C
MAITQPTETAQPATAGRRTFIIDGREFPDPDPALSVEDVRKHYAEFFPELVNADTREEKRGADTIYSFSKRIGTKGLPGTQSLQAGDRASRILAVIQGVPEKTLRVCELARELLDSNGDLDLDAAAGHEPEINLAIAEAQAYCRATEQAVAALRRLAPR